MPLTKSGQDVLSKMKDEYGEKKGEEVFYASINKGKEGSEKWHEKGKTRRMGEKKHLRKEKGAHGEDIRKAG